MIPVVCKGIREVHGHGRLANAALAGQDKHYVPDIDICLGGKPACTFCIGAGARGRALVAFMGALLFCGGCTGRFLCHFSAPKKINKCTLITSVSMTIKIYQYMQGTVPE
jgi:hypothetical protein